MRSGYVCEQFFSDNFNICPWVGWAHLVSSIELRTIENSVGNFPLFMLELVSAYRQVQALCSIKLLISGLYLKTRLE